MIASLGTVQVAHLAVLFLMNDTVLYNILLPDEAAD